MTEPTTDARRCDGDFFCGECERCLTPSHPHDGYAYDGCKCVCCTNVRALGARASARPTVEQLAEALHGFVVPVPTWPHSQVRPKVQPHSCWPCWNGADHIRAALGRAAGWSERYEDGWPETGEWGVEEWSQNFPSDRPAQDLIDRTPAERTIRAAHEVYHNEAGRSWCRTDDSPQPCDTQVLIGILDAERRSPARRAEGRVGGLTAVLASLDPDEDMMYDHPTSMIGPMDPVLFVRWDALAAALQGEGT